jgi:hypothetical protein
MGIEMNHIWLASLDSHTRSTHAQADNKKAKIVDGLPYIIVGGVAFQNARIPHPNNTSSKTAKEVVNCRCRLTDKLKGIDNNNRLIKASDSKWAETTADSTEYKEWLKARTT